MMLPLVSALFVQAAPLIIEPPKLTGAVVETVERASVASGIFKIWHRVTVRTVDGKIMTLFSLSLSTREPLPTPGQACVFQYRLSGLSDPGLNGGPATSTGLAVIDGFSCDSL